MNIHVRHRSMLLVALFLAGVITAVLCFGIFAVLAVFGVVVAVVMIVYSLISRPDIKSFSAENRHRRN